jgi:hypothetical protein
MQLRQADRALFILQEETMDKRKPEVVFLQVIDNIKYSFDLRRYVFFEEVKTYPHDFRCLDEISSIAPKSMYGDGPNGSIMTKENWELLKEKIDAFYATHKGGDNEKPR